MTVQKITLTPVTPGAPTYIQATRGENNARALRFTIIGADNKPIDLTGCTVVFYVDRTKEEKGVVQVGAVVNEDNTATVTLPSGTCAASGEWGCWVQVINPNVYDLRADNLILRVQPCGIDEEGEASSEFTLLTQLIVEAEKVIDELYAAMPYNPNLLDNWYFVRAVNQRGQTNYTAGYTIDRWRTYTESASVTVSSGTGVTVTLPQTTSYFSQLLENPQDYRGKTLAASVQGSGNIVVTVTARKGDQYTTVCAGSGSSGFVTATGTVPNEAYDELRFNIGTGTAGQAIQLKAAKLELGSVSTLKDSPPPHYADQLSRCQRFQLSLLSDQVRATVVSTNTILFTVPTPVTMRTIPTITANNFSVRNPQNGTTESGFAFSISSVRSNSIGLNAVKTAHGLTDASLNAGTSGGNFTLLDANL